MTITISKRLLGALAVVVLAVASGVAVGAAVGGDFGGQRAGADRAPAPRVHALGLRQKRLIPMTPCRIVDTRVAGGQMGANSTREFLKAGGAAQGGKAGGCGVPPFAAAIEANVTAVGAAGGGYLRLWPTGEVEPTATFLNYGAGQNLSNAGLITTGATSFSAKAYAKSTHLVIDVLGYYIDGMWAQVAADGTLLNHSPLVSAVSKAGTGIYRVTFIRDVDGCGYAGSAGIIDGGPGQPGTVHLSEDASDDNVVYVNTFNLSNSSADLSFSLVVDC